MNWKNSTKFFYKTKYIYVDDGMQQLIICHLKRIMAFEFVG
jgi:hypothetical protein